MDVSLPEHNKAPPSVTRQILQGVQAMPCPQTNLSQLTRNNNNLTTPLPLLDLDTFMALLLSAPAEMPLATTLPAHAYTANQAPAIPPANNRLGVSARPAELPPPDKLMMSTGLEKARKHKLSVRKAPNLQCNREIHGQPHAPDPRLLPPPPSLTILTSDSSRSGRNTLEENLLPSPSTRKSCSLKPMNSSATKSSWP